jgi:hypothetical protein
MEKPNLLMEDKPIIPLMQRPGIFTVLGNFFLRIPRRLKQKGHLNTNTFLSLDQLEE